MSECETAGIDGHQRTDVTVMNLARQTVIAKMIIIEIKIKDFIFNVQPRYLWGSYDCGRILKIKMTFFLRNLVDLFELLCMIASRRSSSSLSY